MITETSPPPSSEKCRTQLYRRYESVISTNSRFDRKHVSFQDNKNSRFYNWFKYKEGFSAYLVHEFIKEQDLTTGTLFDPFAGTGTSLFVGRSLGWDSMGIEILPIGLFVVEARLAAESVNLGTLRKHLEAIEQINFSRLYDPKYALQHIPITEGAFPKHNERAISGFRNYCATKIRNSELRKIFEFAGFSILESTSYTRKDGQYLRWDHRANTRKLKSNFDKGEIHDFNKAIRKKLQQMYWDMKDGLETCLLFDRSQEKKKGILDIRKGSCLELLPTMSTESVDLVITSPPYCNRYDYTRTYALELVYLGYTSEEVKHLRQSMLSCTVENRSKFETLKNSYEQRKGKNGFHKVAKVFSEQIALQEVLSILDSKNSDGLLNNSNIPNLVKNYFFEMCFVIYELARLLKKGGKVVIVNDNVRYAGEEVPVDLILTDFAQCFGFSIENILTLERGKGNSSQQMGLHGRNELRKCIYIWRKD